MKALNSTLYLDPRFVLAHFLYGNIARRRSRTADADSHFRTTLSLLEELSPDDVLPESEGMTAGKLAEIVRSILSWRPHHESAPLLRYAGPGAANGGGVVDWAAVRGRLERLSTSAAGGGLSETDKCRVLKDRAELLAQVAAPKNDGTATVQVLEFLLGCERYAVDTSSVREVNVLKEITPVPRTPDFILGVIGVRGRICSVVDLGRVFGLPPSEPGPGARAIVMANRTMEFAHSGRRGRRHAADLDRRVADLAADTDGSTPEVPARGDRGACRGARRATPSHRRRPRRERWAWRRTMSRGRGRRT